MTELCSADLCKLSVQEVADMLLEKLEEVDHTHTGCKVYGCSEGRLFELSLVMKEVKE
jgi:hypothetical protein